MGSSDGTTTFAARYSAAFAAYLTDRSEQALGAAYDLGREAVGAQLSVLDLADAHHDALRGRVDEGTLVAAANFLRESLSTFESVHRGYLEVSEVRAWSTPTSSSCARSPTPRWPSTAR